jgi:hypothetical protein
MLALLGQFLRSDELGIDCRETRGVQGGDCGRLGRSELLRRQWI